MARQKNDGRGRMGGRQKGTRNKVNTELQKIIADFCIEHLDEIQEKWSQANSKESLQFFLGLLRFATPYPQIGQDAREKEEQERREREKKQREEMEANVKAAQERMQKTLNSFIANNQD
ncbi:MAG: hypothetical protein PUB21_08135 [Bacteroidales bacterium]|nr:hypothetical protein [Bacteroidales bacterium]